MTVKICRAREPLSEHDITQVEVQLGLSLPAGYRNFLLAHNGGRPEPDAFPIHNNPSDDHGLVHNFLCIKKEDNYNLTVWAKRYRGRIPSDLLPIAKDPGGNLICLSVSGADVGKVYFWDHEEEAGEGETPGYDNVYFVANSFQEFLESLTTLETSSD
jgi:cell wall assembly regulator SMI1